jgi:hypothetical protein
MGGPSKELDAAASLLAHGVRILQIDGYSVLDAPAVLACLATGAEKLLKLTIGMVTVEETGTWPDKRTMAERYRHAILDLDRNARAAIANRIDESGAPGYIRELLDSVDNDAVVALVLQALDNYARKGRFYNLAGGVGGTHQPDDGQHCDEACGPGSDPKIHDEQAGGSTGVAQRSRVQAVGCAPTQAAGWRVTL